MAHQEAENEIQRLLAFVGALRELFEAFALKEDTPTNTFSDATVKDEKDYMVSYPNLSDNEPGDR